MVELSSPLKYHMSDLIYYFGLGAGGKLGKQIALLGAIAAMAKGMLHEFDNDDNPTNSSIKKELAEFTTMIDMLERAYNPLIDTNPYLFAKARRIRKGVNIASVVAYSIISKHNLVSGNIMRSRLAEKFGGDRIKGYDDD